MDYVALIRLYGSGDFQRQDAPCLDQRLDGDWDCFSSEFIVPFNPCEDLYARRLDWTLNLIRDFKRQEIIENCHYGVHPERPGLFPWARGAGRNYFLWNTVGQSDEWPVVTLGDLSDLVEYPMGAVEFMVRVFEGELDIGTILEPGRLVAGVARFRPGVCPSPY